MHATHRAQGRSKKTGTWVTLLHGSYGIFGDEDSSAWYKGDPHTSV